MKIVKNAIFLFIIMYCIACRTQDAFSLRFATDEINWKKEWLDIFFKEYRAYQENDLVNCREKDRDIRFDIQRKVQALSNFNYGKTMFKLFEYLEKNPMQYDSVLMYNSHSVYSEREYIFSSVSFYFFRNEKIRKLVVSFDADQIPTIIEVNEEDAILGYNYILDLENGCDYGYGTVTIFDGHLKRWRIKRIYINPESITYDDKRK